MTDYLLYWKLSKLERENIRSYERTYVAGGQLHKVQGDDVLWIINILNGRLYLLGHLIVGEKVFSQSEAKQILNTQDELWDGETYVIAKQGTVEFMNMLDISEIGEVLQFVSSTGNDKLSRTNGKFLARQVQAMRQLTPQSAQILVREWYRANSVESTQDFIEIYEDEAIYFEGVIFTRTTEQRKRSRQLVNDAKAKFRAKHAGKLFCEVCGFDFDTFYGIEYIEAHHTEPIASLEGETENSVDAVVMLCANCHRATHSRTPPYTVQELREMMNKD